MADNLVGGQWAADTVTDTNQSTTTSVLIAQKLAFSNYDDLCHGILELPLLLGFFLSVSGWGAL